VWVRFDSQPKAFRIPPPVPELPELISGVSGNLPASVRVEAYRILVVLIVSFPDCDIGPNREAAGQPVERPCRVEIDRRTAVESEAGPDGLFPCFDLTVVVGGVVDAAGKNQVADACVPLQAWSPRDVAGGLLDVPLIQSEKMAALGGIVSGIVHELNTPVGVINSAADVSSQFATNVMASLKAGRSIDEIRDEGDLKSVLEVLGENNHATRLATARIEKIVNSLRSFARLDGAVFEQVQLHDGINTTLDLLEGRLQEKSVVRDFGELPLVSCYSSEMNQVFLNLLTNAIQAINRQGAEVGTITIRTRLKAGRVNIRFSDTGAGIPPEEIGRLFDPTFTRKGSRVKASLGLVACYNIMQKHDGEILVESRDGEGSTFTLVLPVSRQIWPQMA
jgi:signal transduction histidine kinase